MGIGGETGEKGDLGDAGDIGEKVCPHSFVG